MKTMTCPKCEGKKTIEGFSHVANGVCFRCAGSGVVKYRKPSPVKPMGPEAIAFCERILAITEAELETLSFAELNRLRDGCHWHYPQYPDLLKVWRDKGDAFFFAAQEQALEGWRSMSFAP